MKRKISEERLTTRKCNRLGPRRTNESFTETICGTESELAKDLYSPQCHNECLLPANNNNDAVNTEPTSTEQKRSFWPRPLPTRAAQSPDIIDGDWASPDVRKQLRTLSSNVCTLRNAHRDKSGDCAAGQATFHFHNYFSTHRVPGYVTPVSGLSKADLREVWQNMMQKELHSSTWRNCSNFPRHRAQQSRMRSILLDWMIEVCELYTLHRETFHLALDFIDRYLSVYQNIQKTQLQLVGVTALFVAAKLEEVNPPKLRDLTFVTDGACTENEVLDQELVLLKTLKWDLNPITVNTWLRTHLHALSSESTVYTENTKANSPRWQQPDASMASSTVLNSPFSFVQITRLLDLCLLDASCSQFRYSVLSAAAIYHTSDANAAIAASGHSWDDILPCVNWMSPFAITLREEGNTNVKFFENVPPEDSHNIQTHCVSLMMLERAQSRMRLGNWSARRSPEPGHQAPAGSCLLTPPSSDRRLTL